MPFESQPTLSGEYVRACPLERRHYSALYTVASDPLIWEQHPVPNRYEEPAFREFFEESLESGGALLVTDLQSGAIIGSSRFHGYSESRSEIEIGWTFLARSHWGGRYNGDLKTIMLTHAFRFVESVLLCIDPPNHRSQRAAEKIGAIRDPGFDGQGRFVYRLRRRAAPACTGEGGRQYPAG